MLEKNTLYLLARNKLELTNVPLKIRVIKCRWKFYYGSLIWYVRKILRKTKISYLLISTTRGVRNVSFSKTLMYILNEWSLNHHYIHNINVKYSILYLYRGCWHIFSLNKIHVLKTKTKTKKSSANFSKIF